MKSLAAAALAVATVALATPDAAAQRRSQFGSVSQTVNETVIDIEYNRPVARGRTLFGGIVHWGEYWTPGANEATTIEFSGAVLVDGHELPAGRYTMWMIPRADGPWAWIFSNALDVWHVPPPGEEQEQLRIPLEPMEGAHVEVLAFYFPEVGPDSATLRLHWGTTMVDIPIRLP